MVAEGTQLVGSKSGSQEPRKEARTVMQAGGNGGLDWCSSSRGSSCLEVASPVSPDCLDVSEGIEGRTGEICLRCERQGEMGSQKGKSVQVQMLSFVLVPLGLRGQAGPGVCVGVGGEWGASSWQLDSNGRSLGTHRNLGPQAILATSPAGNRWAMI